jgi:hypothetical protein
VTGKTWNRDEKNDAVEHVAKADEAKLKKKLAAAKKIAFKR